MDTKVMFIKDAAEKHNNIKYVKENTANLIDGGVF